MSKMSKMHKPERRENYLPRLIAAVHLQTFLIAAAINSAFGFFDSSCYQIPNADFPIAAAMGHRYENSANARPCYPRCGSHS
jgi:hypothetical protein